RGGPIGELSKERKEADGQEQPSARDHQSMMRTHLKRIIPDMKMTLDAIESDGNIIALDLAIQGFQVDPKEARRLHLPAPGLGEHASDVQPLHLRQGGGAARRAGGASNVGR
ncbi:MAG: hypothetical protein HW376_1499, partial [candidate division NC10 bacterium]|nr:hypothetical protein [candidate division NC10 bacterium]